LPLTFLIYFFLLSKRLIIGAKGFLVFASLFFYSWWNIIYLPIILTSMLFNYIVGNSLNENFTHRIKIHKKSLLTIGIVGNISLLAYFKYADFFIFNVNFFSDANIPLLELALPLAISFFTFQQIAYLVDSYRRETTEYDFLNYALFVTFFPQLIAGPIVHHKEMMPQFANRWNLVKKYKNIAIGIFIFSIGLFKKVVIADTFAVWATNGFDKAETLNFIEAWATSLSYTFQLYFDFSGYTDMAIGIALLFNIRLPINFNSPYKAKDIQDFWRRWHITLSRFLRDYIYIPLGGNRQGKFKTYSNLMVTFILGGLWHGAGWTFVFWGFLHGMALVIHRIWKILGYQINSFMAWFITFNFINISWVFFRAKEWEDAIKVLHGMFFGSLVLPTSLSHFYIDFISYTDTWLFNIYGDKYTLVSLLFAFFIVMLMKNSIELLNNFVCNKITLFYVVCLLLISFLNLSGVHEFLYFNF
jgi:D-alanyl-lipoteichoic acid acyltransferase DltB (MBOAT superfamily)